MRVDNYLKGRTGTINKNRVLIQFMVTPIAMGVLTAAATLQTPDSQLSLIGQINYLGFGTVKLPEPVAVAERSNT
jgi:hypothetical protein